MQFPRGFAVLAFLLAFASPRAHSIEEELGRRVCPVPGTGARFRVAEYLTGFDIVVGGRKQGYTRRGLGTGDFWNYFSTIDDLAGTGTVDFDDNSPALRVEDCNGYTLNRAVLAHGAFSLSDHHNHPIATTTSLRESLGAFEIHALDGHVVARYTRSWPSGQVFPDWDVEVLDPSVIDSQTLVFLAIAKSKLDIEARKRAADAADGTASASNLLDITHPSAAYLSAPAYSRRGSGGGQ
jgi:hypothetical protein